MNNEELDVDEMVFRHTCSSCFESGENKLFGFAGARTGAFPTQ
jgi:hypothetical protein